MRARIAIGMTGFALLIAFLWYAQNRVLTWNGQLYCDGNAFAVVLGNAKIDEVVYCHDRNLGNRVSL